LARAAYSPSDTILLDDCLSAVDAHVGKAILEKCLISGPLSDRTRILVTHALHVLPNVDRIIVIDNGQIVEEGTYTELMADSSADTTKDNRRGMFKQLMNEYGSLEKTSEDADNTKAAPAAVSEAGIAPVASKKGVKSEAQALMTAEERNTGAVTGETYLKYFRAGGSIAWGPAILTFVLLQQASQVINNLFLGYWSAESLPGFSNNDYMAAYAGLGAAQAIFTFVCSFSVSILGLRTSLALFGGALYGVLRSPVHFFDTTPLGRIVSRLSKDQDTLDTQLPSSAYLFFTTASSVLGTVFLVFYTFPLLGILFVPLSIFYWFVAIFYR
jgi:ATP-binding cassette subfamily C (CFTR/MRP) protein 1